VKKGLFQFLLILLFSFAQQLFGQNETFIHFTEDDGLSSNITRSITKDADGFMWFGTDNGLSKYDGSRFINYRKTDGLPGNGVWSLASDKKGNVYAGCYLGGLCILKNNKISKVLHLNSKYPDSFRRLYYSEENKILVAGTDFGLFLLKDTTFYEVKFEKSPNFKISVLNIIEYKGYIYSTHFTQKEQGRGLFRLKINPDHPQLSTIERIDKGIRENYSLTVVNDTLYTNKASSLITVPINNLLNQNEFIDIRKKFLPWVSCRINNHKILVGGFSGNVDMNSGLELIDLYSKKKQSLPLELSRSTVNDLLCDSINGVTWICADNGIYGMFTTPFLTRKITGVIGLKDVICFGNDIYFLGNEWIYEMINDKFIKKYSVKVVEDSIIRFRDAALRKEKLTLESPLVDPSPPNLICLKVIDKKLFVISNNGTISLPLLSLFFPIASSNFVFDKKGGCINAVEYSKVRYHPSKEKFEFIVIPEKNGGIRNVIKMIYLNQVCYMVTWQNGIYAIRNDTIYNLNPSNSVIDNFLTDIEKDPFGEIWCTSNEGHLFHIGFNPDLKVLSRIGQENSALIGDNFKWLKFNDQNLYVGTNKGLNIIDIKSLNQHQIDTINFYNHFNGYENVSADAPSSDGQGNIYLYTPNDLIEVKKEPVRPIVAKFIIDDIRIDNKTVKITELSNIVLTSTTKDISISFLLLKYPSSKNTIYRYRLNEGNWIIDNKINLEPIKSGDYSIELGALDKESGKRYGEIIKFQIDFPFWEKWWFLLLLICFVIIITFAIVKFRVRTIKKQQSAKYHLLIQISELQIRSLQVQMNPHFIFNSLNSIQNFVATQNTRDAITYLGALGSLIRMNLEYVSRETITLEQEIEFLQEYIKIELMRFKKKLRIELKNEIQDRNIPIPPMIVQPIIENAIKHGIRQLDSGGLISVNFVIENGGIKITIEDNGVGRKEAELKVEKNHHSKGLGLINERLQLLNQKHKTDRFSLEVIDLIEDGRPSGTRVLINLASLISI